MKQTKVLLLILSVFALTAYTVPAFARDTKAAKVSSSAKKSKATVVAPKPPAVSVVTVGGTKLTAGSSTVVAGAANGITAGKAVPVVGSPANAVPEASTMALVMSSVPAVAFLFRRKK